MQWIQGLNPEQAEAVLHNSGPLLILAGAGSGKTTVLVARTGRLIQDEKIKASRICVLTFTNKAARELKHRVSHRIGPEAKAVWAGTFHAFGLSLLKKHHKLANLPADFGVLDQTDSQALIRELLKEVKVVGKDRFDLDRLLSLVQLVRAGQNLRHEAVDEYTELSEVLSPKYEKRLELLGVVDFESLLLKPLELFKAHPEFKAQIQGQFDQIMVDEFQDTNQVQMKLIQDLIDIRRNITVVGDDDQSIYGWRGAEVKNILQFPQNYKPCRVIKLGRNYRSQPAIVNLANAVIAKNQARHGKILRAEKGAEAELPEVFVMDHEDEESEFVVREIQEFLKNGFKLQDLAVLYRSNAQGALIESGLRRTQIPYSISGGTSIFDRKEAKDMMAFLRQALSPNEVSLKRIINLPARGIGDATLELLNKFSKKENIPFAEACLRWQEAGLPEATGLNLGDWMGYLQHWPRRLISGEDSKSPGTIFLESLDEIGYKTEVYQSSQAPGGGEKRWMVAEIFSRILDQFLGRRDYSLQSLREFVEVMTLRDHEDSDDENKVQLMTLHASKGLEFPIVFLVGIEEDLLPHRSLGGNIDEERRLFYVGITRAQQKLILTHCRQRKRHGALRPVSASRFLLEVESKYLKEFPNGVRPVAGAQRDQLISSFLAGLEEKIGPNKSRRLTPGLDSDGNER